MKKAMENQVVLPKDINHTSWGNVFIAYFPMHDEDEVVGVLGIEFDASSQYRTFSNMKFAAPLIICIFVFLPPLQPWCFSAGSPIRPTRIWPIRICSQG